MNSITISKEEILKALRDVKDPEIPTISVVDLGIVSDIELSDGNCVKITLTPTFSGCPALKTMENMVKDRVKKMGVSCIEVKTTFDVQWNTDMITTEGIKALKKHGLAPPREIKDTLVQIDVQAKVKCPLCGSGNTTLQTPFGPTLCRSIHYCNNCLNAFEQFKPVE